MSGVIAHIESDSIAQDLDWQVGDEIVSINSHEVSDILDFYYYTNDDFLEVEIKRGEESAVFEIEKDADMSLGVSFEDILFDGIRSCGAHCIFCFVEQLPKGLRKSLYVKDDDFRLSFLHGNFVTLANVSEEELERIVTQHLSPLYISVHTTDIKLRDKIIGRKCPDILHQLDVLTKGNISLDTQIVLCPGVNDGAYLDQTIADLSKYYPQVKSIAIVPAGLSVHRKNPVLIGSINPEYSLVIIKKVRKWQRDFLKKYGTRLVWAADEFYLNADVSVPSAKTYEGYPQIENGIGLVRKFLESAHRAKKIAPKSFEKPLRATFVTGVLAAPVLEKWAESLNIGNLDLNVCAITNTVFGHKTTVTGLMCGRDIINTLKGQNLGDVVIVPDICLRDDTFLDDVMLSDVERELKVSILKVKSMPYHLLKTLMMCSQ